MQDNIPDRIVVSQETPLQYWCSILNCEEQDLLFALSSIGYSYEAVNIFLFLNRRKKNQ